MSWLKKRLPKKRWKRVCLYLLSTLLILLAADMALVQYWRRITISPETTRITAPLTLDGYPDYLAALNAEGSRGVTAENNAAPLLLQLVPAKALDEKTRAQFYDYFGISAQSAASAPTMVPYASWLKDKVPATVPASTSAADDETTMLHAPWRGIDHPQWQQWLDQQQAPLAALHQACLRDRYYMPLLRPGGPGALSPGPLIEVILPQLGPYRSLANLAMARAMMRLGDGDTAGFQSDITDALKLSRLVAQGPTLIEKLVALAIDSLAQSTLQAAATSNLLDAAAVQKLQAALAALPPLTPIQESIDHAERYMFLDFVCLISQHGIGYIQHLQELSAGDAPSGPGFMAAAGGKLYPVNCNATLRQANSFYDRCMEALAKPTYREQRAAFDGLEKEIQALMNRNILARITDPGSLLLGILVPSFGSIARSQEQAREMQDLAVISLHLRQYQLQHQSFPDTLSQLGLPPESLRDRFSDQPLIYRQEAPTARSAAGYILYSVGPDGHDDGGKDRKESKTGWDIVVRTPRPTPK